MCRDFRQPVEVEQLEPPLYDLPIAKSVLEQLEQYFFDLPIAKSI